jgi:hypothetical protein
MRETAGEFSEAYFGEGTLNPLPLPRLNYLSVPKILSKHVGNIPSGKQSRVLWH